MSNQSGDYFRSYTHICKDVSERLKVGGRSDSVYLEGFKRVFLKTFFKVGDQDFLETAEPISLKF